MRTYVKRNRHGRRLGHIRGYSAHLRRKNPSADGIIAAAVAVGVGLVASVVVGYAVDAALGAQSPTVQTGALVAIAAGSAFFLPAHPAIAAGIATGLLLIPLTKQVYTWFPALANAAPVTQAQVLSPTSAAAANLPAVDPSTGLPATTSMQALHMRGMGKAARKHKSINALHMGRVATPYGMQALHMNGMGALHMRGMGNTFYRGGAPNPVLARSFGR